MDYSTFRVIPTEVKDTVFFFSLSMPEKSQAINIVSLENEAREAQNSINNMIDPTDEELLLWAKQHYPFPDYSEKERLEDVIARFDKIKSILSKK
jgi:hypothetical protein